MSVLFHGGRFPAKRRMLRLIGVPGAVLAMAGRASAHAHAGLRLVIDLRDLLREVPDTCSTMLLGSAIALEQCLPESALPVLVGRESTRQLLMHVVAIACEAMPDGGALQMLARAEGEQAVVNFVDGSAGAGAGEGRLAALFHRSLHGAASGAEAITGTQASVAACLQIAHAHDGRIYASPSPLGRMGVTLRLPRLSVVHPQGVRA